MHVVLVQPLIPQNTGAIGRLCVCTDSWLHLIEPMAFELDEKRIKKAGMDYWPDIKLKVHPSWEAFLKEQHPDRMIFCSTKTQRSLYDHQFEQDDYIVFGNESHGLPATFYEEYKKDLFTIPMPGPKARSHNLANSVSIALYEGLRQTLYS